MKVFSRGAGGVRSDDWSGLGRTRGELGGHCWGVRGGVGSRRRHTGGRGGGGVKEWAGWGGEGGGEMERVECVREGGCDGSSGTAEPSADRPVGDRGWRDQRVTHAGRIRAKLGGPRLWLLSSCLGAALRPKSLLRGYC